MKNSTNFRPGCNDECVRGFLQHYDLLTEDEEDAEDKICMRRVLDAEHAS